MYLLVVYSENCLNVRNSWKQRVYSNRAQICNFRSTTPLPPTDTEETTLRESSETPKEEATTPRETSTRSTLTTPFREPRVLSKVRLEPKIEKIRDKPTAKVRTVLASKNVGRLTTTRSRETTILPTSSFRTRGNIHGIVVLYLYIIKIFHNYDYSFITLILQEGS